MTITASTAIIVPTIVTIADGEDSRLGAALEVVEVGGEFTNVSCRKLGVIDLSNSVSPNLPCHTANAT